MSMIRLALEQGQDDWTGQAACAGRDVDEFFSEGREAVVAAKAVCASCPVRLKCLAEAQRVEGDRSGKSMRFGIYGGLTADERARQRRIGEVA